MNITVAGAEGGPAHNGYIPAGGGLSSAVLSVRPDQVLKVYVRTHAVAAMLCRSIFTLCLSVLTDLWLWVQVGGPGREADSFQAAGGGFNGGGSGQSGSSGGGASDVRTADSLGSRVVVAGGGAGSPYSGGTGGAGGGTNGVNGVTSPFDNKKGGGGGTQTAGGALLSPFFGLSEIGPFSA